MNIRQATLDDVGLLAGLNEDVQRIHAAAYPHLFKQPDYPAVAADFETRILGNTQGQVYIAEVDGEAVGYIYALKMERPDNPYTYAQRYMLIDQISVRPSEQGRGYGRKLIEAVIQWAADCGMGSVTLNTWGFNVHAHGFFEAMGFKRLKYSMGLDLNSGKR
ncbi:MAG: GNAT family N-acetyltransferase [Chloroflexi bacterium]|nr:GNAT family N-acetyltransferase [Chloroflexota bacterium]MCC6895550.1 GNAT family N-acetyltransferase [Anaerolineae bacterium]